MPLMRAAIAVAALLTLVAATPKVSSADAAAAARVRAHVEFLADDLLEGRDTGSTGHAIAAAYVASQFKALGLEPAGPGGSWYQMVPLRTARHAKAPEIALVRGGRRTRLEHGQALSLRPSLTVKERSIDAPLVFVGHGVSDPKLGIDEYAGLDVRGKIVVALRGVLAGLPSDVAAHLESSKDDIAAAKGAAGFAELSLGTGNPAAAGADRPVIDWVDPTGAGGASSVVGAAITLSPQTSALLFEDARMSLKAIQQAARTPIPGFDLGLRMTIKSVSRWDDTVSPQVIGRVRGSDPKLSREHVMLMGHLDHLGVSRTAKPGEDRIFNGALDNAAGIASMIEAARAFSQSRRRPRRSVLFAALTGEEKGLRGADYLASHPPVPIRDLVGLVNLDMPLLLYPFTDVIAFGAEHSTIARTVAASARSMGVRVAPDPMPRQSLFVRSDHYRFVVRGVPAVFLMTGHANGGKQAWEQFLATRYHRVSDDLSQKIDWNAAARFAELNFRIARALADAPQRPHWYRGSYFGDRFAAGQPRAER